MELQVEDNNYDELTTALPLVDGVAVAVDFEGNRAIHVVVATSRETLDRFNPAH